MSNGPSPPSGSNSPWQLIKQIDAEIQAAHNSNPSLFHEVGPGGSAVDDGGVYLLVGNSDTLTGGNNIASIAVGGTTSFDKVNLGSGADKIGLVGFHNQVTLGSGAMTVALVGDHNSVSVGNGSNTIAYAGTGDTFNLEGTSIVGAYGSYSGHANFIIDDGGTDVINTSAESHDHSSGWGQDDAKGGCGGGHGSVGSDIYKIGAAGGHITIYGLNGAVDLDSGLGYSSARAAANALKSDGHGGSILSLGSHGYIDFIGGTPTAANFHIT